MPRPRKTAIANAKSTDPASSRMADAMEKSRVEGYDGPIIFYEKSATIREGDDYFRATVAITTTTDLTDEDEVKITKTFERLSDIINKEIDTELGI